MHQKALLYYHNIDCHPPAYHPILFLAQQLCIMYKNKPVVPDIAITLQETERKSIREEYLAGRMNIHPSTMEHIDQYARTCLSKKRLHTQPFIEKLFANN